MPVQKGIIKLRGTVDDLSFYKSKDGFMARYKSGVDGKRIKNDPAFKRTRENGMEFGRAAKAGKLLRHSLVSLLDRCRDFRVVGRLHKLMVSVLHTDSLNRRGERKVEEGDISLLEGFNFNVNAHLSNTVKFGYDVSLDRTAGEVNINLPQFVPENDLNYPSGATHFRLLGGAAELDFSGYNFKDSIAETEWTPIDINAIPAMDLGLSVSRESEEQIFIVFGVEFAQEVNGFTYPMQSGAYNSLAIVKTDTV